MDETYSFKVNLTGMIDILGNHIYSSKDVFMRELLQNGVDAISSRKLKQANWREGYISITLYTDGNKSTIEFYDNGIGLNREDIHKFLAVIGQSSKKDSENTQDYIGQFGIGLLSCFMVSNQINIITKSINENNAYLWKGTPDGLYTLKELETDVPVGTTIYLKCKSGAEEYFSEEKIRELIDYYGSILPIPIYFISDNKKERLNSDIMPWDFKQYTKYEILEYGESVFSEKFIDCIPINSTTGGVNGVAYIISHEVVSSIKNNHHIYLKNMFLTENGESLLPEWAFFVKCILNTQYLTPTASRESFYQNDILYETKKEIGNCIIDYLSQLSRHDENMLHTIISIHNIAIKSLAITDKNIYKNFIDYIDFETSEGMKTGYQIRTNYKRVVYTPSIDTFRQLSGIYVAQNKLLINAGYIYDKQLIIQLEEVFDNIKVELASSFEIEDILKEISFEDSQIGYDLINIANRVLEKFQCKATLKRFKPEELPALYVLDEKGIMYRNIVKDKEDINTMFANMLDVFKQELEDCAYGQIYFNLENELIKKLLKVKQKNVLANIIELIYLQTLLIGHFSLRKNELKLFNVGISSLLDWGLEANL